MQLDCRCLFSPAAFLFYRQLRVMARDNRRLRARQPLSHQIQRNLAHQLRVLQAKRLLQSRSPRPSGKALRSKPFPGEGKCITREFGGLANCG